jgi:hypothetical protein
MYYTYYREVSMIIHHSKKILEQLSEVEKLISTVETYMEENGIDCECEKILLKLIRNREGLKSPRFDKD